MTVHPPAPADFDSLIDAYEATMRSLLDLGAGIRAAEADLPTDCPTWSVKDQFSHIAAVEHFLAGGKTATVEVVDDAHIRNAVGRLTEPGVLVRRDRDLPAILEELDYLLHRRLSVLRGPDVSADEMIDFLGGLKPLELVLRMRVADIWTHLQDVREAVGRPGDLDTVGAAHFVATFFATLPKLAVKDAGLPVGTTVIVDVTGPTTGRAGVRVEDHNGTARGVRLFTGTTDDHETSAPTPDAGARVQLALTTAALCRLAAGRRSADEVHVQLSGDEALGRRLLEHLTMMP